jgi:cobalt-zinc-cadmium efflux system protein
LAGHGHSHALPVGSKLKFGILLSAAILAAELIGGFASNSLALLSDAGHVFTDMVALTLSWYAVRQALRPASHRMTFGYHRIGVLIAIVNALLIFGIAVFIFFEAYQRLSEPPEVNSGLMILVAAIGLAANLFMAFWLRGEQKSNLNVRSAFWHVMGDALASVGVIAGGVIIMLSGLVVVDVIVSVLIGLIILVAAWQIFREGLHVLLEATPKDIDIHKLEASLKDIQGVKGIHDVHVWSISPEIHAMSCHVLIDDCPTSQAGRIRQNIEDVLLKQFGLNHTTLQMECSQCKADDFFCQLTVEEAHRHEEGHRH